MTRRSRAREVALQLLFWRDVNPTAPGGSYWDPYKLERNLTNTLAAQTFAMIYCDAQGDQDVYFVGRMFRTEPTGPGA